MRLKEKNIFVEGKNGNSFIVGEAGLQIVRNPFIIEILCNDPIEFTEKDWPNLTGRQSAEVHVLLHRLKYQGIVTEEPPVFSAQRAAFWQTMGFDDQKLFRVLQQSPVTVKHTGNADAAAFAAALVESGVRISSDSSISVVLTDDYQNPELNTINHSARNEGMSWLLVQLSGSHPKIGPLFTPNDHGAPCWECLRHRLRLHDQGGQLYRHLEKTNQSLPRPEIVHPLGTQQAISVAILEFVKWLYHGHNQSLSASLIELNILDGTRQLHSLIKRPQCSVCGDPNISHSPPAPVEIRHQNITSGVLGGYRTVSPEDTWTKYCHHISSITGIIPKLKPYGGIAAPLVHNYTSGKNIGLRSKSMFWLSLYLHSGNGGKGKTEIQAKVGALAESIERYSLMYHEKGYVVKSCFRQLEDAIHPNSCMGFSEAQYEAGNLEVPKPPRFSSLVPARFDENAPIEWTPVYSLSEKKFKYLPSGFCYAQYPFESEGLTFSFPDSNGCAAGNTLEEAILQGFLELVERDAAAIWWYNRIQRPEVDLSSAKNEYIDRLCEYYNEIGRKLYVLDLTNDLGIPVFASISYRPAMDEPQEVLYAFGAHLEVGIALERAIVEMNQLLPLTEKCEGKYRIDDPEILKWLREAKVSDLRFIQPKKTGKKKNYLDYPKLCPPTIHDAVHCCIEKARKVGLETLVLDLTLPDVGMPVAKVMVPGLRHMWRRTGPGRLFNVPVKMGWLEKPLKEEELNPLSIFI